MIFFSPSKTLFWDLCSAIHRAQDCSHKNSSQEHEQSQDWRNMSWGLWWKWSQGQWLWRRDEGEGRTTWRWQQCRKAPKSSSYFVFFLFPVSWHPEQIHCSPPEILKSRIKNLVMYIIRRHRTEKFLDVRKDTEC